MYVGWGVTKWYQEPKIIMVNVIPPDHVDDVPVVEPNQHDDVLVVPKPVLVNKDEDPKEDEFEEEEDPQEEEDDMEVDIKEDENEPKLTYPYKEVDPLNPSPPTSESEPNDEIEVEDVVESEDETVPASVHEVGELSTAPFLREDSDGLLPCLMRRDINSLFGRMASLSRRLCGCETAHALVEKKGKAKDKYYGNLILDFGNEVRSSVEQGTAAMGKLVERLGNTKDKVECRKLEKELEEERGSVFEKRPNEAIDVPIKDEKSPPSESRGSPHDSIMPPKSAPMTQAAIRRMIKESVDADIAAERASAPAVRECTFAVFMKCNPTVFRGVEGAVKLRIWFKKTKSVFEISECAEGKKVKFAAATLKGPALTWWKTKVKEYDVVAYTQRFNELALMCPRMVEPERVNVDAYIMGLTDNIKGEVTSSKPADLNEVVRMAHKLMEQKSQAIDARILEGKKRKIAKSKEMPEPWLPLLLMESFLCVNDVLLPMLVSVQSSAISVERLGTRQGIVRRRVLPRVLTLSLFGLVMIVDTEPQGPNVVTGTFLLNNRYAFILFDSGSDRSFVDTRFSSMLDIVPVKIGASYELGTFDVIIGMDWLVKHDAVIVCGEKVVRIPYGKLLSMSGYQSS
ncbi:hypothetical protein Tco_0947549 [Tanacetum coccineum]